MEITGLKSLLDYLGLADMDMRLVFIGAGVFILAVFVVWLCMRPRAWKQQHLSHRKEWMIQQKKP